MATRKLKIVKVAGEVVCLKRRYHTQREAKRGLKECRRAGVTAVYECRICGYWHLTSQRDSYRKRSKK